MDFIFRVLNAGNFDWRSRQTAVATSQGNIPSLHEMTSSLGEKEKDNYSIDAHEILVFTN
jgi:hypothetical protein